jgi:outer membrane receptor for ferrienterochelin and colicins
MKFRDYSRVIPIISFLLIFSSLNANEKNFGILKGEIINNSSKIKLPDVNIIIENTILGTASNGMGNFIIERIPEGVYTIKFSALGFKKLLIKNIKIETNKITTISAYLKPIVLELQEVVITGTRSLHSLKDVPVETNLLSAGEIRGVGLQTLTDAIRWVPGVNISGGAPNGAARRFTGMIHGLPAQYSLILIDGQRAKSEHIHTGTNINLVPVGMIDRIEVIKGPASALYGSDAFGGVVNIITKPMSESPVWSAEMSYGEYNTQNINVNHGSTLGNLGYYVNVNVINTDGIPDNNNVRFDFSQKNLLGKLSYQLSRSTIFKLNARYYANKYLRNVTKPKVNDSWIDVIGRWENKLSDKSNIKTGLSFSHFKGEYRDDNNRTIMADIVYDAVSNNNSIVAGIELRNDKFSRNATPKKETNIFSAFIKNEINPSSLVTYITALRVDNHEDIGTEFTPKFGALFKITPFTDIRASLGKGFRAPSLQDLYEDKFNHKSNWRDGNPDLKPEYSLNYNLSVEHRFNEYLLARISGFRNDFKDMIMTLATGDSLEGLPIHRRENIQEALAQGIESEIRFKTGNLNAIISYTFSSTEDDEGDPLAYSPRHMTNLRIYYYWEKIGLGTMCSVEDARNRFYKIKSGGKGKLKDYTLINLSINKKIFNTLLAFLRIENLLDQEFEIYEDGKSLAGYGRSYLGGIKIDF